MSHTLVRRSFAQGMIASLTTSYMLPYSMKNTDIAKPGQGPSCMLATTHSWYAHHRVPMRHPIDHHSRTLCSHPDALSHTRPSLPSDTQEHVCIRSGAPLPCKAISQIDLHFQSFAGLLNHLLAGLFIKRCFATLCLTVRGLHPAVSLRPLVSKVP